MRGIKMQLAEALRRAKAAETAFASLVEGQQASAAAQRRAGAAEAAVPGSSQQRSPSPLPSARAAVQPQAQLDQHAAASPRQAEMCSTPREPAGDEGPGQLALMVRCGMRSLAAVTCGRRDADWDAGLQELELKRASAQIVAVEHLSASKVQPTAVAFQRRMAAA